MSLRIKLILALLLTSLAALALVAWLAYARLNHSVDSIRRQQAAAHFHDSVAAYLTQYGSWEAGNAAESMPDFIERQNRLAHQRTSGQSSDQNPPPDTANGPSNFGPRDGQPDGPPDPARPPPPPGDMAAGEPPGNFQPRDDGRNPGPDGRKAPRYKFVLTDEHYRVLLGAGIYQDHALLPESARDTTEPVLVNGRVAAYISTQGTLAPTEQELKYLNAMRDALTYGVAGAALLAVALGLALGTSLSRNLAKLTNAVRAMKPGALHQQVAVQGKDEIATLAASFNQMSAELASSHDELHASHQKILEQAQQLKELSIRDALTQLYNRRHFDEQAAMLYHQSLRHGHDLTVVIGDIDFFKRINDQFSHATGDAVLRQVGSILREHMRLSDLVARYGGEEFVIALPATDLPQAAALCDKLRNTIETYPWQDVHPDLKVTMSMGLCADLAVGTVEAMLQKADALLYRAKESGRNRVCFS